MRTQIFVRSNRACRTWGALVFCSFGLLGLLASGCGGMEDTALASPTTPEASLSTIPRGFTLADLPGDLALSAEQSSAMASAIDQLNSARQGRRHAARGEMPAAPPPMVEFLEASSRVLSPDQFEGLARFLNERRLSQRAQLGDRIREKGARMGDRWAEKRGAVRELRRQVEEGTISLDAARDRMKELRHSMRDRARGMMTPEQSAKREQVRTERMANRIERRLESLPSAMDRRADFLGRVLGLDPGQTSQVHTILSESVATRRSTLEQLRAGSIEPEDAAYGAWSNECAIGERVRAILTPEQQTRFDALESLLPKGLRMNGGVGR